MRTMLKEESEKNNDSQQDEDLPTYDIALGYINDTEIPVQGHGLIMLTNLVKKKDEETINNIEKVLQIFQVHLGKY